MKRLLGVRLEARYLRLLGLLGLSRTTSKPHVGGHRLAQRGGAGAAHIVPFRVIPFAHARAEQFGEDPLQDDQFVKRWHRTLSISLGRSVGSIG
ncbi:hypothetical protein [Aminobacter aminovorans]|uniref:hypothetical protein n=1 Tax=Aminobacter aminovorans TaxID=83263 RepID=UPI00147107A6|nr:hypothetical protein [Aminobacter aminovorans]